MSEVDGSSGVQRYRGAGTTVVQGCIETLVEDLVFPEGPTRTADGGIAFVEAHAGRVNVFREGAGAALLADVGGLPSSVVRGPDDALYIAQPGDWLSLFPGDTTAPSVQRIGPEGSVGVVATQVDGRDLAGPNDLVVGPDGRLYVTDPGRYDPVARPDHASLFAVDVSGRTELLVDLGPGHYPNGIAFDTDGTLLWDDSYTGRVHRLGPHGEIETVAELDLPGRPPAVPDGMTVDGHGRILVACFGIGCVMVCDGADVWPVEVGQRPTNILLDETWMYVTDAGPTGDFDGRARGLLWRLQV